MSTKPPNVLGIKAEAVDAWHALAEALEAHHQQGRTVACQGDERELWFSTDKAEIADAAETCTWCPLRRRCLTFAVPNRERHGVWAGYNFADPAERRKAAEELA